MTPDLLPNQANYNGSSPHTAMEAKCRLCRRTGNQVEYQMRYGRCIYHEFCHTFLVETGMHDMVEHPPPGSGLQVRQNR